MVALAFWLHCSTMILNDSVQWNGLSEYMYRKKKAKTKQKMLIKKLKICLTLSVKWTW